MRVCVCVYACVYACMCDVLGALNVGYWLLMCSIMYVCMCVCVMYFAIGRFGRCSCVTACTCACFVDACMCVLRA